MYQNLQQSFVNEAAICFIVVYVTAEWRSVSYTFLTYENKIVV